MADIIKPTSDQLDRAGRLVCTARGLDPDAPALEGDWGRPVTNLDWYKSEAWSVLLLMLNKEQILRSSQEAVDRGGGH